MTTMTNPASTTGLEESAILSAGSTEASIAITPIVVRESWADAINEYKQSGFHSNCCPAGEALASLPSDVLTDLCTLLTSENRPEPWDLFSIPSSDGSDALPEDPPYQQYYLFAVVRSETDWIPHPETNERNGIDGDGVPFATYVHPSGVVIQVVKDKDQPRLGLFKRNFAERNGWEWVESIVPQRYRYDQRTGKRLTRYSITPFVPAAGSSPVPEARQQKRIDRLRKWSVEHTKSLLLYGPYNTSKTTYAATFVTDVITLRVCGAPDVHTGEWHPCVWAIDLNEWFEANLAWRTRDYSSPVERPMVGAATIKKTCEAMNLPPVLWIEELDKVNFTGTNRKWLHTLINCVYSKNGCIIVTTNKTRTELLEELGDGIVGRLDGSRDGGDGYICLDFTTKKVKV